MVYGIYLFIYYCYLPLLQQLVVLERERIQKWVKMIKNWEKYIRGEKVLAAKTCNLNTYMHL